MAARFDQYATYLKSPEYAAEMAALLASSPDTPRTDWPVDYGALYDRHREIASMAIGWAVENMNRANEALRHEDERMVL